MNHDILKDPVELVKRLYEFTGLPAGAVKDIIWTSQYK